MIPSPKKHIHNTVLPIALMGEEILKQSAKPVQQKDLPYIRDLSDKMIHTVTQLGERIGLAAPQVFEDYRLFVYRIPKTIHSRYGGGVLEELPFEVVINPVITFLSDEKVDGYEACISVPHMMGRVSRFLSLQMDYVDLNFKPKRRLATGFHARVIQHEFDHLEGIVYPMRMTSFEHFGFEDVLTRGLSSTQIEQIC